MSAIFDLAKSYLIHEYPTGSFVLEQGGKTGRLYVLMKGSAEVLRDHVRVGKCATPGIVFGEVSVLLQIPHTASVRALEPCEFAVIDDPSAFFKSSPEACLEVAELLARRLDSLTKYLIDVKRQYEGHDHLGMVDEVLEALIHRQAKAPGRV